MKAVLPTKEHVFFERNEGCYNYLNPKEESVQYYFVIPHLTNAKIKEMGLKQSFLIDPEKDYNYSPEDYTPLELLSEIKAIYESYWIHSGKDEPNKLIEYLESIEKDQYKMRLEYDLKYAEAKVETWKDKVENIKLELEDIDE